MQKKEIVWLFLLMFLQESQIIYYSSDLEYVPQTESESGYLIFSPWT